MASYSMHLRDGTEQVLDPEGLAYVGMHGLRKAVLVLSATL